MSFSDQVDAAPEEYRKHFNKVVWARQSVKQPWWPVFVFDLKALQHPNHPCQISGVTAGSEKHFLKNKWTVSFYGYKASPAYDFVTKSNLMDWETGIEKKADAAKLSKALMKAFSVGVEEAKADLLLDEKDRMSWIRPYEDDELMLVSESEEEDEDEEEEEGEEEEEEDREEDHASSSGAMSDSESEADGDSDGGGGESPKKRMKVEDGEDKDKSKGKSKKEKKEKVEKTKKEKKERKKPVKKEKVQKVERPPPVQLTFERVVKLVQLLVKFSTPGADYDEIKSCQAMTRLQEVTIDVVSKDKAKETRMGEVLVNLKKKSNSEVLVAKAIKTLTKLKATYNPQPSGSVSSNSQTSDAPPKRVLKERPLASAADVAALGLPSSSLASASFSSPSGSGGNQNSSSSASALGSGGMKANHNSNSQPNYMSSSSIEKVEKKGLLKNKEKGNRMSSLKMLSANFSNQAPLIKMASPALLPAQALPQPVVVVRPKFDLSLVSADVRSENMRCNICRLLHETLRYDQRAGMRLEQEIWDSHFNNSDSALNKERWQYAERCNFLTFALERVERHWVALVDRLVAPMETHTARDKDLFRRVARYKGDWKRFDSKS